jgi:hypothetical protein
MLLLLLLQAARSTLLPLQLARSGLLLLNLLLLTLPAPLPHGGRTPPPLLCVLPPPLLVLRVVLYIVLCLKQIGFTG